MSTNISIQATQFGSDPDGHQPHWLPGTRPDDLPISAGVWDVAKNYGKDSAAVVVALYEAVKQLEAAARSSSADTARGSTRRSASR